MTYREFSDAVTIQLNLNEFTVGTYTKVLNDIKTAYRPKLSLGEYADIIDAVVEMINDNLKSNIYTKKNRI
jgi:hypothetical protein